jgi:hypothetical protein
LPWVVAGRVSTVFAGEAKNLSHSPEKVQLSKNIIVFIDAKLGREGTCATIEILLTGELIR